MVLASVDLSGMGGVFALPVLPLVYAAPCVAVARVQRRRRARWVDQ